MRSPVRRATVHRVSARERDAVQELHEWQERVAEQRERVEAVRRERERELEQQKQQQKQDVAWFSRPFHADEVGELQERARVAELRRQRQKLEDQRDEIERNLQSFRAQLKARASAMPLRRASQYEDLREPSKAPPAAPAAAVRGGSDAGPTGGAGRVRPSGHPLRGCC